MRHGRRTGKSAAELIAKVLLSHHGIHNWTSDDQKDYLAQRCGKDEHYAEIKRAFEELFNRADIAAKLQKAAAELSAVQLRIGTVVLCSATQPPFERDSRFPLLPDERSSMTGDYHADFDKFRRTVLVDKLWTQGYTFEEAADFCYNKFSESGSLLVIADTVIID